MNLAASSTHPDRRRRARSAAGKTTTYGELREQVGGLPGRAGRASASARRPARRSSSGTTGTSCPRTWPALGAGLVVVPLNPLSPAPELRARARGGRRPGRGGRPRRPDVVRRGRSTAGSRRWSTSSTAARLATAGACCSTSSWPPTPCPIVERDARRPRRADVHHRHGRLAQGGHADPRQPAGQPRAVVGAASTQPLRATSCFGVLPLFHIFGLNVVLGATLLAGARVVLVERFDPASAVEPIGAHGASRSIAGPPNMWAALAVARPTAAPSSSARVRLAVSGAAALPDRRAERVKERFGLDLAEGYGLTETAPTVTSSTSVERPPGSVGRAGAGRRGPPRRRPAATTSRVGDPGEVWVRGPNVFRGYWNDPEATARGVDPRRLAAHRRRRPGRRRRLPLPRRPDQGPDHRVGLQRVPGRGRGRCCSSTRRGRGGRGRRAPPPHRRGGEGLRRARRARSRSRRTT